MSTNPKRFVGQVHKADRQVGSEIQDAIKKLHLEPVRIYFPDSIAIHEDLIVIKI